MPFTKLVVPIFALTLGLTAPAALAQSAASAYTTGYRWDAARRLTGQISAPVDPASPAAGPYIAVRYTYDVKGQLTKIEKGTLAAWQSEAIAPANWTGFTVQQSSDAVYDAVGNKVRETVSAGGTVYGMTQASYDGDYRPLCTMVRMDPANFATPAADPCIPSTTGSFGSDRVSKTVYDAGGQVVQVRQAVGTPREQAYTTTTYTPNGKQEYLIDANGNRARFEYDGFDRQAKWIFPAVAAPAAYDPTTPASALATAGALNTGDYELYSYDAAGNRIGMRKRDGSVLAFTFDALNRMTTKTVPERLGLDPGNTRDVYYSYDLRGLMTAARFDSAAGIGIKTTYDSVGRITGSINQLVTGGGWINNQYDASGNRTQMTYPDANFVSYSYDGLGRPSCILMASAASCTAAPAANRITSYTYNANGQRTGMGGAVATSYDYDPVGRLSSLTNTLSAATYNNQWTFQYNPASQIVSNTRSNDAFAWTGAVDVARTYTANGLNQYTAAGSAAFCYDANGNLIADGTSVYLYDIENRLVEKRAQGTGNTNCAALSYAGGLLASLRYDPMGRLYEVTGGSGTTGMLYDGDALVAEYDGAGNLLRRYVHGTDAATDDPIAWFEGSAFTSANERIVRSDWQGSIVLVTDQSGANALVVNRYDEYGIPQSTNAGRFQYTGQAWLAELGMYYYKARVYSPTLGRFLQTDPIGYKDQANLYAYVGNDPVNRGDPTGLWTCGSSEKQCDSIEKAIGKVADAASHMKAGSSDRKALESIVAMYGARGADNGITIQQGALDRGTLGQTSPKDQDGKITVTLDFKQINAAGGLNQGAVTIAHEGVHVANNLTGREAGLDGPKLFDEERVARYIGARTAQGLGWTNPVGENANSRSFRRDLNNGASQNCWANTVSWELANNRYWPGRPCP